MMKQAIAFGLLLLGVQAGMAQVFQVFQKDGTTAKFQAAQVDSLSHSRSEGITTLFLTDGSRETFLQQETDSVVWYNPENSILSKLQSKGIYKNFLRLVQENGLWADYLNGATDLTVFASDDESWQRFFEENAKLPPTNPWSTATSYGTLTAGQKQELLSAAITGPFKMKDFASLGKLRMLSVTETGEEIWRPVLTPEFCNENSITEDDQNILFGAPLDAPWTPAGSFTLTDEACCNGYLNVVPLRSTGTMADAIRTNGKTNIFASMMDSVLAHNEPMPIDPSWAGTYPGYSLWHSYDRNEASRDICAMFVPNDGQMWWYFTEGAGTDLILTYYFKEGTPDEIPYTRPQSLEELYQQIGSIPTSTLLKLVKGSIVSSFIESVPSKWSRLRNGDMEPRFEDVDLFRGNIDTCLVASNGAVYVFNEFCLDVYNHSVVSPIYAVQTCKIINWAVYNKQYSNRNYHIYLNAPQQDITFFLPTDAALAYYYDPISMKSRTPRVLAFRYSSGSKPVSAISKNYYCQYNKDRGEVGTIGFQIAGSWGKFDATEAAKRLKDILYSHTIVNDGTQDIHSRNEFFRTLGGDVVKVERDAEGRIVGAKGTFQIENERQGIVSDTSGVLVCNVTEGFESLSNGQTYALDAPLVPTSRSLWSIVTNDADMAEKIEGAGGETLYSEFYKLCTTDACDDIIIGCGLVDKNLSTAERKAALKKYKIFTSDNGLDYNFAQLTGNTPYTAYIPTNEAVRNAITQGLPTWEEIREDYTNHCQSREDSIRIAGKIKTLTNVVKAHFHFGLAIADQEPFQKEYKSLLVDEQTLASPKVKVISTGNGNMSVTDREGQTFNVVGEEKNIFVHDYTCSKSPANTAMTNIAIETHRPGVVHQIDGVLGFK